MTTKTRFVVHHWTSSCVIWSMDCSVDAPRN